VTKRILLKRHASVSLRAKHLSSLHPQLHHLSCCAPIPSPPFPLGFVFGRVASGLVASMACFVLHVSAKPLSFSHPLPTFRKNPCPDFRVQVISYTGPPRRFGSQNIFDGSRGRSGRQPLSSSPARREICPLLGSRRQSHTGPRPHLPPRKNRVTFFMFSCSDCSTFFAFG